MGQGFQNPELTIDELYEQGRAAQPDFEKLGQNFLDHLRKKYPQTFDGVYFEKADLKEIDRVRKKVSGDYAGDHTKVTDIVRGRLVVETPDQINIIRAELKSFETELGIVKTKDLYAEPLGTHFRTLNTQIRLPNGHVSEFRIDQHDMAIASHENHKNYEKMQEIERAAKSEERLFTHSEQEEYARLLQEQRTDFDRAAQKNNLDTLLNEKGHAMMEHHRSARLIELSETFGKLGKNGGIIAGVALGTLSGAFTLAAGGSKAEAAQAVYEAAVPYGETQIDLARGDVMAAEKSATIETASNFGSLGGAAAGAVAGASIGSVVPVIGTTIGGIAGGVIGGLGGGVAVGAATEYVMDNFESIKGEAVRVSGAALDTLNSAAQKTRDAINSTWGWFKGDEPHNSGIMRERGKLGNMSLSQLGDAIVADNILPDTVRLHGKMLDVREALKDPAYLQSCITNFETMHERGDHDYSRQIALFQELQERQAEHQPPAPATSPDLHLAFK